MGRKRLIDPKSRGNFDLHKMDREFFLIARLIDVDLKYAYGSSFNFDVALKILELRVFQSHNGNLNQVPRLGDRTCFVGINETVVLPKRCSCRLQV